MISDVDSASIPLTSVNKFLLFFSSFSFIEVKTEFAMVSVKTSKADCGWLPAAAMLLPVTVCVWVWVFSVGDACVGCMWVVR